jgi:hypothetical protein
MVTVAAFVSAPAQATMVAGWDFSQYLSDSVLSVDGAVYTDTLSANYSNLDPTFGAGAESTPFGTLFLDGSFGSTNVGAGSGTEAFVPTAGSLISNIDAPGAIPFDSLTVLVDEGQLFANFLGMTARDVMSVVFKADLNSQPLNGSDWTLSFAGKTFEGTSTVGIEFSTDGVSYAPFGSVNLDTNDKPFSVNLGTGLSQEAFVRLVFNPANGQPILDNVAIGGTLSAIPEPGTALLLVSGLAGLHVFGRRRA